MLDLIRPVLLLSFFCDLGSGYLNKKHLKLIEKYASLIEKVVKIKIRDPREQQDVCQHVKIQLIKSYKNRYKYGDDWDNIIRSIIRRRVGDYRHKFFRNNNRFINENELSIELDSGFQEVDKFEKVGLKYNYDENIESFERYNPFKLLDKKDYIEQIRKIILDDEHDSFNEWDKEYVEIIYELYESEEEIDEENIMEFMGYESPDKNEFKSNVKLFNSKIKNIIK